MLTTNQKVMMLNSMLPPDKTTNKWQRIGFLLFTMTALTISTVGTVGSVAYFLKNRHTNIKESIFALIVLIGAASGAYVEVVAIVQRYKMAILYEKLSDIHDSIKSDRLERPLTEANEKCEWMWKGYSFVIWSQMVNYSTLALISVFLCWWTYGEFNIDHFYHPINLILPWNRTTYWGYFAEIIFATLASTLYYVQFGAILLLFISMYIYYRKFFEMFELIVQSINGKQIQRTEALLCDLIRFRVSIQEWFMESTRVYSQFVMVQLVSGAALLTISAYFFDSQLGHIDSSLYVILFVSSVGICTLFVYCYIGAMATERFEKMADTLYESNWRDLPVHLQKYFIIMIADMQRPIRYHGFGKINLDLNTFIALIKAVFSYYMALKTLTTK